MITFMTRPLTRALAALARVNDDALPDALAGLVRGGLPTGSLADADPTTLAAFRGRAEAELGTPWPQPLARNAARFHLDGNRIDWEHPAFARQHRLTRVAVLAAATGEEQWIDETLDGAIALCEQSSWCWPAHDDTLARHGSVLATVTDPYVDLGAGEAVGQLAWLDAIAGELVERRYPGFRARLAHEARTRVLDPFVARRDWRWIGEPGHVNNWNPWIHGNVIAAALQFLDGGERAHVLSLAIEGMDHYVAALPDDGAIDEGYAYWWNGACRLVEALDLIAHATGLDATGALTNVRETLAFPHRMHLGGEWFINVSDAQARQTDPQPWHALYRAAARIGARDAAEFAALHRDPARPAVAEVDGLGRAVRGIADPAWLAAGPGADPQPARVWLPSTQMLVVRDDDLAVATKGGHNAESHNHNDVGSVIVASGGVPVVVDAGRPTYDARTFSDARYELWMMQSEWHGVPFVNGRGQLPGASYAARDVAVGERSITMDLVGAYDVPGLASWIRTVTHDGSITIADSWELEGGAAEFRLLLAGSVELGAGSCTVTPVDGAPSVVIEWDGAAPARLVEQALEDPMLTRSWGARLTRLDIDVTGLSALTVRIAKDPS
ncbi:heparinase [Microbacterium sorbitolivorans]|uniref:Heparinase II/III-like C-terminal domain-containing protein n=2 Tax=Microbacterium sorbitolivorans TaxID=1867410 RepID=A0A367Y3D0_9MICO|nr:hypothetical protein DTO57_07905 [Microbacterium sorbitolivorans]GGF42281.1 heparinase [Microbacterium sorbitolivorans]